MKQRPALIDPPVQPAPAARFAAAIKEKLTYVVGARQYDAELSDWFLATALALRDRILDAWISTEQRSRGKKRVYYLSIEYLTGRLLCDTLGNMTLTHPVREALASLGIDLSQLRGMEPDPALGSGGLRWFDAASSATCSARNSPCAMAARRAYAAGRLLVVQGFVINRLAGIDYPFSALRNRR